MQDKSRYILKEGDVVVTNLKKAHHGHHLVLFNDKVVICKKNVEKKKEESKIGYTVLNELPVKGTIYEDAQGRAPLPQTAINSPLQRLRKVALQHPKRKGKRSKRRICARFSSVAIPLRVCLPWCLTQSSGNDNQSFKILTPSESEKREWMVAFTEGDTHQRKTCRHAFVELTDTLQALPKFISEASASICMLLRKNPKLHPHRT